MDYLGSTGILFCRPNGTCGLEDWLCTGIRLLDLDRLWTENYDWIFCVILIVIVMLCNYCDVYN